MKSMREDELRDHIFSTYISLRYGIATIGFIFPILLFVVGSLNNIHLQGSMSHYYFALSPLDHDSTQRAFPVRTWFVGVLFVAGAFLYLYKGFSKTENFVLNLAGAFAIGVAVFPMRWDFGETIEKALAEEPGGSFKTGC